MDITNQDKTIATVNQSRVQNPSQANMGMTLKDFLLACLYRWKWFVISVILALVLAFLFLAKKQPVYTRTAQVLIKNTKGGGSTISDELSGLSSLGIFSASASVSNELLIMRSPALLIEVARRMNLDVNYTIPGYRKKTLYGKTQPVKITFANLTDDDFASLEIKVKKDGTFEMDEFMKNGVEYEGSINGKLNTTVKTPLGRLYVATTPAFVMPRPIRPIRIAMPIAMTTQMLAILRDSFSLFSFSIAMNLRRM